MLTAQLAKQSLEIQLARPKRKKEPLLKPASSGNLEKVLVVGGGLTVVYTFWATMPIAAAAAVVAMGLHFSKEIQTFQSPERAELLRLLWESKTVAHPSMLEAFKQQKLAKVYPTDAINQAVDEMSGESDWFVFQPSDNHPLANFGEVYCWQDPLDKQVMLPIEGLHKKMRQWGLAASMPTQAISVPTVAATPSQSLDELADTFGDAPPVQQPNALEFLRSLTSAPLQPVIIAGLPGSGKGVMAALALSLGVKERGLRYWIFNPKNALEEAGYWSRTERHYLKDRLTTDENLFDDLMATLEAFSAEGSRRNNIPGKYEPFILLLEEITCLIGLFTPKQKQVFKSKLTALASLLRKCNMAIWLSGQSVTLEDLGFSGTSNRAMFTAIAAVGPDRTGCKKICDLLEIPFNEASLPPGRCWLTDNAVYPGLQAPGNIPQYPTWQDVPNLIDLRPYAAAVEVGTEQHDLEDLLGSPALTPKKIEQIADAYQLPSPVEQLEKTYQMDAVEPTAIREVAPTPSFDNLPEPLNEVARYIHSKGGELPVSSLKNWGKSRRAGALNSEAIDDSLLELMELQLIETFTPIDSKGEWVRWIAT